MSERLIKDQVTVFDAEAGATANSIVVDVRDYRHVNAVFTAASSYAATVKAFGSYSQTIPVPGSAASASNEYFPVEMKARNNDASIVGTTGVVYAGSTDGLTAYGFNDDNLTYVFFKISSRTAGTLTVKVSATTNE